MVIVQSNRINMLTLEEEHGKLGQLVENPDNFLR